MDLAQMYTASPDWLKLLWIVLPSATIYGVARIWGAVRLKALAAPPPRDPPAEVAEVAWVEMKDREEERHA